LTGSGRLGISCVRFSFALAAPRRAGVAQRLGCKVGNFDGGGGFCKDLICKRFTAIYKSFTTIYTY